MAYVPRPEPDSPARITTYIDNSQGRCISAHDAPGTVSWTTYDTDGRVIDRGFGPAPGSADTPASPGPDEASPDEPHIVG